MSEGTPPPPPAAPPPPPPPPAVGPGVPGIAPDGRAYATWPNRALGFFIDYLPLAIISAISYFIYFAAWGSTRVVEKNVGGYTYTVTESAGPSAVAGLISFVLWILAIAYWFWNKGYREGTTGQSLGKQVTGFRTVNEATNEPLGFGMGSLRAVLVWIEFVCIYACGLGLILWLWPLWDNKRQALLSDKATNAVVFKAE